MNTPPPTPNNPDANPTNKPIMQVDMRLNGILASTLSLLKLIKLLTATNNNKQPNIIFNILDDKIEATIPPITPPAIPKMPKRTPGSTIPSIVLACLYAPLKEVGMIIAKLVHRRSEERRVGKECRSRWSPYH